MRKQTRREFYLERGMLLSGEKTQRKKKGALP
jgi:hypothetical protein